MSAHALFLSYDGMTDPLGQSQVIPYLEGLARAGYRISLISHEKPEVFAARREVIQRRLDGSGIRWLPLPYTKRPPILSTVRDIRAMTRAAEALHAEDPVDLVHARSYIAAFAARHLQRHHGVPWIFDMRGFYADERVDGGLWPKGHPVYGLVYRYFKRKEKEFLRHAEAVVSLTHAGKRILAGPMFGVPEDKVHVIPCCADLDRFHPSAVKAEDVRAIRRAWKIPEDAFVVMYLGSVGTWYMLPEMLAWFKGLLEHQPEALFAFVTGEPEAYLMEAADAAGVPRDKVRVGKAPHEYVPAHLAMADLGIFFIKPVFSKQASSPVKMGEMMGMGLPLVCNSGVGDVDAILQQTGAGLAVDARDASGWAHGYTALERVLETDEARIRQGARDWYALDAGVGTYVSLYRQTLDA